MSHASHEQPHESQAATAVKVSQKWLEVAVYTLILGADIFYTLEALALPGASAPGSLGAGGFPAIVGVVSGILLLMLIGKSVMKTKLGIVDMRVFVHRPLQVIAVMMVMMAQVVIINVVGPIIGIILLAFLVMWLGGERRYVLLLTIPPLLSLGIYAIFVLMLGVYFG